MGWISPSASFHLICSFTLCLSEGLTLGQAKAPYLTVGPSSHSDPNFTLSNHWQCSHPDVSLGQAALQWQRVCWALQHQIHNISGLLDIDWNLIASSCSLTSRVMKVYSSHNTHPGGTVTRNSCITPVTSLGTDWDLYYRRQADYPRTSNPVQQTQETWSLGCLFSGTQTSIAGLLLLWATWLNWTLTRNNLNWEARELTTSLVPLFLWWSKHLFAIGEVLLPL